MGIEEVDFHMPTEVSADPHTEEASLTDQVLVMELESEDSMPDLESEDSMPDLELADLVLDLELEAVSVLESEAVSVELELESEEDSMLELASEDIRMEVGLDFKTELVLELGEDLFKRSRTYLPYYLLCIVPFN